MNRRIFFPAFLLSFIPLLVIFSNSLLMQDLILNSLSYFVAFCREHGCWSFCLSNYTLLIWLIPAIEKHAKVFLLIFLGRMSSNMAQILIYLNRFSFRIVLILWEPEQSVRVRYSYLPLCSVFLFANHYIKWLKLNVVYALLLLCYIPFLWGSK